MGTEFLFLQYLLTSLISSKHYSVGNYEQILIRIIYNQITTKHWMDQTFATRSALHLFYYVNVNSRLRFF